MTFKRRILEAMIEEVQVEVTGAATRRRDADTRHVLAAGLVYPRPAIAERMSLKRVTLTGGKSDLGDANWGARVLFKEVVQGPFSLSIEVTRALSDAAVGKLLAALAKSLLKVAGGELDDASSGPWMSGLATLPIEMLEKLVPSSSSGDARAVGTGSIDLCADAAWRSGVVKRVKIPLTAPTNIRRVTRRKRHGVLETRPRTLLAAGRGNGCVTLLLRLYD